MSKTTLKIGDAAPALAIGRWVQGEPVEQFQAGTVYVIDFWATWCGPCVRVMPHLSDLQRAHSDMVFIAVNCREADTEKIDAFVSLQGAKMGFRVGTDRVRERSTEEKNDVPPQGVMFETWMHAAGERGIPHAFVVDRGGRIAWIGHSGFLSSEVLQKIAAGEVDYEHEARLYGLNQAMRDAMDSDDPDRVLATCDEFLKFPGMGPEHFCSLQFGMALRKKDRALADKFAAQIVAAHREKNIDAAQLERGGSGKGAIFAIRAVLGGGFNFDEEIALLDQTAKLESLLKTGTPTAFESAVVAFENAHPARAGMFTYDRWRFACQNRDGAAMSRHAASMAVTNNDNQPLLHHLAWELVNPDKPAAGVDTATAMKIALRAAELHGWNDAGSLDTAACACFLHGDRARALELQEQAVQALESSELPPEHRTPVLSRLKIYRESLA